MSSKLPKPAKPAKRAPLRTRDLLPILDVDLTVGPGNLILPCTEARQAHHLNWYVAEVRATNRSLKLYDRLPMICAGSGCYWASQCETAPEFLFLGLRCPLEAMEIYRHWVGYIRDMEVQPSDYVDLQMVADLVRIELQITRIDQQLQINAQDMLADKVGGVIQSKGEAVYEKQVHPLLVYQNRLRKDRNDLYSQLEASREAKRKARQTDGKIKDDVITMMMKMKQLAGKSQPDLSSGEIFDVAPSRALPEAESDPVSWDEGEE